MTHLTRRSLLALAAAASFLGAALPAAAQEYPSKPVTLIVSYAAGGGTDAIARVFAARLEKPSAAASSSRTAPALRPISAPRSSLQPRPTAIRC